MRVAYSYIVNVMKNALEPAVWKKFSMRNDHQRHIMKDPKLHSCMKIFVLFICLVDTV